MLANPYGNKAITVLLILSLCLQGFPSQVAATELSLIPAALGKIEESYVGTQGKTIVYIQDAHTSLEAQENIAKIIQSLVQNNGVKTVFEEGYEGAVPTNDYFGFIKNAAIKEKVAYFLMDRLRLGGAEYAHVISPQTFKLIGADSRSLHRENILAYQKTLKHQTETEKDLTHLQTELDRLIQQRFPKEIKEWLKLKQRFEHHELNPVDYFKRTAALLQENAAIPIQPQTFFEEIDRLENNLAEKFLKDQKIRKIFEIHKALTLFKKLNRLELTASEYAASKIFLKTLNTETLAEFLVHESGNSVILAKEWETRLQKAVAFYEIAHARDLAIEQQLDGFLKNQNESLAVLVFGGFHKDGIKEILHRKNLSYQIVSPKITALSPRHQNFYKQLMTTDHYGFQTVNALKAEPVFSRAEGRTDVRLLYESIAAKPDLSRKELLQIRPEIRKKVPGIELLVVDLDGTLYTFPEKDFYRNAAYRLFSSKFDVDFETAKRIIEEKRASLKALGKPYGDQNSLEALGITSDEKKANEDKLIDFSFLRPDPELKQKLLELEQKYRLVLATNNSLRTTHQIFRNLDIPSDIFERIYTQDVTGIHKPDIRLFQLIEADLKISPQKMVSIGDRLEADIVPAEQAGAKGILVEGSKDFVARIDQTLAQIELSLTHDLRKRMLNASDFPDLFKAITSMYELQSQAGRMEDGVWKPFFRVLEDGQTVDYGIVSPGNPNPVIYRGEIPHDVLQNAEAVLIQNVERARRPARPGLKKQRITRKNTPPLMRQLEPRQFKARPDQFLLRWKGPSGHEWWFTYIYLPIWIPNPNRPLKDQFFHMVGLRGDKKVHQAKMIEAENIEDLVTFLSKMNASPSLQGHELFRLGVSGWYYSRKKNAYKAGPSQTQAHSQLMRFPFPIEKAKLKERGIENNVKIFTLDDGWGTGIVLEASKDHFKSLAETQALMLKQITQKGHTFNYLLTPSGNNIRIFTFDRTAAIPEPYFTGEWGYAEMGRAIVIDGPSLFYDMTPKLRSEFDNLPPEQWLGWIKAKRRSGDLNRINPKIYEQTRESLKIITAPQEEIETIVKTLLSRRSEMREPIHFTQDNFAGYIWGGTKIRSLKNLTTSSGEAPVAESWEISTHSKFPSRVQLANGTSLLLSQLLEDRATAEAILGKEIVAEYGPQMPFILKILDVNDKLSVQVHPNNEVAAKFGEKDPGKQEDFIVLSVDPSKEAIFYLGLRENVTQSQIEKAVRAGEDIRPLLNKVSVKPGEIYRVPAGIPHAWTEGVMLVELAHPSDLTYRLYDYGRGREMHIEKGLASINFKSLQGDALVDYLRRPWQTTKHPFIQSAPVHAYWKLDQATLVSNTSVEWKQNGRFHAIMAVGGTVTLEALDKQWAQTLAEGHTVLIPTQSGDYEIRNDSKQEAKVLHLSVLLPHEQTKFNVGISMGGTKMAVGAVSPEGLIGQRPRFHWSEELQRLGEIPSPETLVDLFLHEIERLLAEFNLEPAALKEVGVAWPGPGDYEKGIVSATFVPGFTNYPLKETLEIRLKERFHREIPVQIRLDVMAGLRGEQIDEKGNMRNEENGMVLNLATGIAAALVKNGKLIDEMEYQPLQEGGTAVSIKNGFGQLGRHLIRLDNGTWDYRPTPHGEVAKHNTQNGETRMTDWLGGPALARRFMLQVSLHPQYFGPKAFNKSIAEIEARLNAGRDADLERHVLEQITILAKQQNPIAINFIRNAGQDAGEAIRTFLEAYPNEAFHKKIVVIGGIGENLGLNVLPNEKGEDIFVHALRKFSKQDNLIRSPLGFQAEILGFRPIPRARSEMRTVKPSPEKTVILFDGGKASNESVAAELAIQIKKGYQVGIYNASPFSGVAQQLKSLNPSRTELRVEFGSLDSLIQHYERTAGEINFVIYSGALPPDAAQKQAVNKFHGRAVHLFGETDRGALGVGLKHLAALLKDSPADDLFRLEPYIVRASREASTAMSALYEMQYTVLFAQAA